MAKGRKTGGRKKGAPNKVTAEARAVFRALLDKKAAELDAMIDETRYGIEIEKTTDAGTVVGRLNADPGKAVDLILKMAEFCIPKLGRQEHVGEGGGPVEFVIRDLGKEG
jgi:hypothetical protein